MLLRHRLLHNDAAVVAQDAVKIGVTHRHHFPFQRLKKLHPCRRFIRLSPPHRNRCFRAAFFHLQDKRLQHHRCLLRPRRDVEDAALPEGVGDDDVVEDGRPMLVFDLLTKRFGHPGHVDTELGWDAGTSREIEGEEALRCRRRRCRHYRQRSRVAAAYKRKCTVHTNKMHSPNNGDPQQYLDSVERRRRL